jgi:choice-of-anchor C domain-containing protein
MEVRSRSNALLAGARRPVVILLKGRRNAVRAVIVGFLSLLAVAVLPSPVRGAEPISRLRALGTDVRAAFALVDPAPFGNGSFEVPVTEEAYVTIDPGATIGPWVVTAGQVDLMFGWATAQHGRQSVDMSGFVGGKICQSFDTTAGATYDVSFWMSHNAVAVASASLAVTVNGVRFGPFTHDAPSDNRDPQWERHALAFTATGPSAELCFESSDPPVGSPPDGAAMLDNVTVADRSIEADADLALAKADSPDPVRVGQPLTYTLTVTNRGPSAATGVTLTDTLPARVTFESADPSQGSCNQSGGTVGCDLGSLAGGADATVTIVVTPTIAGTLTNTATVTGDQHDPSDENNRATAGTIADARACPPAIGIGETIECSIDAPGEVDAFQFTTTAPSTRVLLRVVSAPGSPIDPEVRVFRPTGTQLCAAARSTPGLVDHQCTLSAASPYSIRVGDRGGDEPAAIACTCKG